MVRRRPYQAVVVRAIRLLIPFFVVANMVAPRRPWMGAVLLTIALFAGTRVTHGVLAGSLAVGTILSFVAFALLLLGFVNVVSRLSSSGSEPPPEEEGGVLAVVPVGPSGPDRGKEAKEPPQV